MHTTRRTIVIAALFLSVPLHFLLSQTDGLKDHSALLKSRPIVTQFMQTYKTILLKAMSSSGASGAISVCADTAQAIAHSIGERQSVSIKRVSTRWRNPANAPDRFEDSVLALFGKSMSEGELNDQTEYFTIVLTDSGTAARYLKPIIVQSVCLSCHGYEESLTENIRRTLKTRYPDDRALGYSAGELRGAVSVILPIR
ncbi:MAG: Tll0287-like domain-containing protein [Bacteroidota bacterium]